MKFTKFLAIAACAMMVGSAFAGVVQWRLFEDAGLSEGSLAYLFSGDSSGVADAIAAGTFDSSTAIANATTDEWGEISANVGSFVSQSVSLYMVVFDAATEGDASNYIVSDTITQSFGIAGDRTYNFTSSFANSTWTPISSGGGDDPDPSPGGDEIVPEPTSVALLALGLAAFGLKRKVA